MESLPAQTYSILFRAAAPHPCCNTRSSAYPAMQALLPSRAAARMLTIHAVTAAAARTQPLIQSSGRVTTPPPHPCKGAPPPPAPPQLTPEPRESEHKSARALSSRATNYSPHTPSLHPDHRTAGRGSGGGHAAQTLFAWPPPALFASFLTLRKRSNKQTCYGSTITPDPAQAPSLSGVKTRMQSPR